MASLAEKLEKLRESERNMITGPPNAAAVDFIKKTEGFLYPENTSFESKLANDPNATVDNTYFPSINPRTSITGTGTESTTVIPEILTPYIEELREEFPEQGPFGDADMIITEPEVFMANDKVVLDDTQKIGLTTIQLSPEDIEDGVDEQTASNVAIDSFETHQQAITDEVLKVTASDEAVRNSLANSAEILKEREKEEAIAAHDKFQNDRIESIANASDSAVKDAEKNRLIAEEKAKQLNRIQGNLNPIIQQVEELEGVNVDAQGYSVGVNEVDDVGVESGTAITDTAKFQDIQKRVERERNGGEAEALNFQKRKEILERQAEERNGGEAEARQVQKLSKIKDKLDEERRGTGFGTSGDAEGQRFADLPTGGSNLGQSKNERLNSQKEQESFDAVKNDSSLGERVQQRAYQSENEEKAKGAYRKLQADKKAARAKAERVANVIDRKSDRDNLIGHKSSLDKHNAAIARGRNDDPYHFTTLAYPPDAVNSQENGHFMLFYVNVQNKTKYGYNFENNSATVGDEYYTERATAIENSPFQTQAVFKNKGAGADEIFYHKQMIRNGGKGNIIYNNQAVLSKSRKSVANNLNSLYPTTTRITDSVALYLPPGIGHSTNVTYGDFATGVAGYLAMSGLDITKQISENDFVGAATSLFDKGGQLIKDALKNLALEGISTVGAGEGLVQNFDKIFGQTVNPYIEVAFQSSGMRSFEYTFNFAPKSQAETDEIQAIIGLFRFHMLPELKGTSHRYLTLPSTFDIHYMWQNGETAAKENSFYNKIATCVCDRVDVNYTPNDEVQSFSDGAPTQITMTLSFKETEMMTKQHVQEGF